MRTRCRVLALTTAIVAALFFFPRPCAAQVADEFPAAALALNWGFQMTWFPDAANTVQDVPARLRQLPSHAGDSWIYGRQTVIRTIPSDTIEPTPVSYLASFYVAPELSIGRFRLRAGPTFASRRAFDQGLVKANTGATRQVNQYGQPGRGSGTSLVYYNMFPEVTTVPGWFGEAGVTASRGVSLFGGIGHDTLRLVVETGYDRFDTLETYRREMAALVRIWRVHGGVDVQVPFDGRHAAGLRVSFGQLRHPLVASGMTIGTGGKWYAAVGLNVRHVLAASGRTSGSRAGYQATYPRRPDVHVPLEASARARRR